MKSRCGLPLAAMRCEKRRDHLSNWHKTVNRITGSTIKWKLKR